MVPLVRGFLLCSSSGGAIAPYSLTGSVRDADLAAAPVMHIFQVAFGPTAVDDEHEDELIERWAALLALASCGKLRHPTRLPLAPKFWQQLFAL